MKGLLIVDVQNDFCKNGALEVPHAEEILPFIIDYCDDKTIDYIIATSDWHPEKHISFASTHQKKVFEIINLRAHGLRDGEQMLWPDHCVANTWGAALHSLLPLSKIDLIFQKGQNKERDSYSAFLENDGITSTGLIEKIQILGIKDWIIVGLATDYCVKATALDAVKLGLNITIDLRACRSVNTNKKFLAELYQEFREKGIILIE